MSKHVTPVGRVGRAYPRKRSVVACQACRARKTKCDQKKPRCSFCETINSECVFDPNSFSSFDPASLAILNQIQGLSDKVDRLKQSSIGLEVSDPAKLVACGKHIFPETIDSILQWSLFEPFHPTVSPVVHCDSPASASNSGSGPPNLDELDPTVSSQWLDRFFASVHIKNPVLNEDSTRRLVRRVCHHGVGWNADSCLALLVCANGALALPFPNHAHQQGDNDRATAESLYRLAQRRIGLVIESSELHQAQCYFFAGVYLMSVLKPFQAWRMFLQALAACQSFSSSTRSRHSALRNSDQECLYWSCWKSEREVRCELGLPDFSDPTLDHAQAFPSLATNLEGEALRAGYFFLSEIALWRLEMKARNEIASVYATITTDIRSVLSTTTNLSRQLVVWQESLAPSVKINLCANEQEDNDVLRFVLKGRVTYYYEILFWNYLFMALKNEQLAAEFEDIVRRGLEAHLERLIINTPGFYYRHHGTWLMLRSSARSACIILLFAQKATLSVLLPSEWSLNVETTIDMLQFWSTEIVSLVDTVALFRQLLASALGRV